MVAPKLNRRRALFVLDKIDEILAWENAKEREKDVRFVDLGRYLCETRAGQYWRTENLKSFDEFLERRFPESRRKAYYLMAIHENLTKIPKQQLREIGWRKATEMVKVARRDGKAFDCAPWVHKAKEMPRGEFEREVEKHLTGKESESWEMIYGSEQEFVNMCVFVGFLSDSLLGPPMPLHLVHVRCRQCFPAFCGSFASDFGPKCFRGTIP